MQRPYEISSNCRVSNSSNLVNLLSLGDQPLANSLKTRAEDDELRIPLTLCYCPESALLQLRETVKKELLFSHYLWVSGTAATTRDFAEQFSRSILNTVAVGPGDLIVEIGSNDGTFLKPFIRKGLSNVLGVDPAANIAEMANQAGVRTLARFWSSKTAEEIATAHGNAKIIIARNVIAHVSELHDVMAGVERLLLQDGVGAFEFHYAGDILDGLQYDSIYHEHLCYFSLQSFSALLNLFHLTPFHVEFSPISGGALVVYFSKKVRKPSDALQNLRQVEDSRKINRLESWQLFAERCLQHKQDTLTSLLPFAEKTVVGYGASARSATYLNFCGITHREIKAVIDNNSLKHSKFTPGSSIPIVPFSKGLELRPDLIFIFAWNFRDEVIKSCQEKGYRGQFMVAFPNKTQIIGG
jgi:C-methyltransferase-like protein/putative zinc binding protein/methyltransferase family protein